MPKPTLVASKKRPRSEERKRRSEGDPSRPSDSSLNERLPSQMSSSNANGKDDGHSDDTPLLSPHTLRLLKLIQDGTEDHARMASEQLQEISKQAASPLVLWDILGRLQGLLISPYWNTRRNAQLAMEGVARNLPASDQRTFLQATDTRSEKSQDKSSTWLRLEDVNENLSAILEQGQHLLANPESKYQVQLEDQLLDNLEEKRNPGNAEDGEMGEFWERRLEMQRQILLRRLGLSDVMTKYTASVGKKFQCDLVQEGIRTMEAKDDAMKRQATRKKPKIDRNSNDTTNLTHMPNSIRSLLLREIKQQQQSQSDMAPQYLSHRKPQALLAGELVYRMFDPSWFVRHGSLMGILALLRSWRNNQSDDNQNFGTWPHDVLARVICVLTLDRFGDFSGSSAEAYSGSMVAPVREMAGQVFSLIFYMAPEGLQQQAIAILFKLIESGEWEVRQGVLLGVKYVLSLAYTIVGIDNKRRHEIESKLTSMAMRQLQDPSDDVQGVAAQVLLQRARREGGKDHITRLAFHSKVGRLAWESLERTRSISSSLEDMIALFTQTSLTNFESASASMGQNGNLLDKMELVLTRFGTLLDCETISVKISIVHAIGLLSSHVPNAISSWKSSCELSASQNGDDGAARDVDLPVSFKRCFCGTVKIIYDLRNQFREAAVDDGGGSDAKVLLRECSSTWGVLASTHSLVLSSSDPLRYNLEEHLLSSFFCLTVGATTNIINMTRSSHNGRIAVRIDIAESLASFWASSCSGSPWSSCCPDILQFCIIVGLKSPLFCHCEASCCLIRSLLNAAGLHAPLKSFLVACTREIMDILSARPVCLKCGENDVNETTITLILQSFRSGFRIISRANEDLGVGAKAAARVDELWQQSITIKDCPDNALSTIDSMRINSLLVGTIVSQPSRCLPRKLTPIVRPIMTSLQNEEDRSWQDLNCWFLKDFLVYLWRKSSSKEADAFKKTFGKVMENLCNLTVGSNEPGAGSASIVIGLLVNEIPTITGLHSCSSIWERLSPLHGSWNNAELRQKEESLSLLQAACQKLSPDAKIATDLIRIFIPVVLPVGCEEESIQLRDFSVSIVKKLCAYNCHLSLKFAVPALMKYLSDIDVNRRGRACYLLVEILSNITSPSSLCPFVHALLPIAMGLMTDSLEETAAMGAGLFSRLVQVAPLVKDSISSGKDVDLIINHLIHGKKLPPYEIPEIVSKHLIDSGIVLRDYQLEGISWLRFLQQVKLNGALCDSMGLGKTVSALIAIALSHLDEASNQSIDKTRKSLIVCPSSIVGHWMNEIKKFLPNNPGLRSIGVSGTVSQRRTIFDSELKQCNLVVTSYAVMRSEIEKLSKLDWTYVVLDEGHLLKNPKTATARASRKLGSRHRLVLSGTPVQNHVKEVWAIFDFLMPHFLGSSDRFSREFAGPISRGQKLDSRASDVAIGMEKLKQLHQQVLPFILRREKDQVLKELPPKVVTTIPCPMSPLQQNLYHRFCCGPQGKLSLLALNEYMSSVTKKEDNGSSQIGKDVLRSLLYLRLLCTHPWLVRGKGHERLDNAADFYNVEASGKLLALMEILSEFGLVRQEHAAADNDTSLLYCEKLEGDEMDGSEYEQTVCTGSSGVDGDFPKDFDGNLSGSRCLIFAQFMDSLDVVENVVLKRHMPSCRYLRLDGRVPPSKRSEIVDAFNQDESVKVLLLTTKIGGLGLNLTGADTVIFLEHDWNPHVDLQAMDRAHRLGQKKTVHVYQLVTENSIEEKTMSMHEKKLAMSQAIVNTENSSLYSLGTERLLDIFQFRSETSGTSESGFDDNLDALIERYNDEYQSLSMDGFVQAFCGNYQLNQNGDER
jgi:superfamily II DNA or RNA helicase